MIMISDKETVLVSEFYSAMVMVKSWTALICCSLHALSVN